MTADAHAAEIIGRPHTAQPGIAAIAMARGLVLIRCHLEPKQALTYVANYATLSELSMDAPPAISLHAPRTTQPLALDPGLRRPAGRLKRIRRGS